MANIASDVAIEVGMDISPLLRETQRAAGAVKTWGNSVSNDASRGSKGVSDALARASQSAASFGLAFTKGLAAGLVAAGFAAITSNIRGTISAIADLQDQSARVGLGTTDLQGLADGFKLAGVSQDAFNTGLDKFTQNIGDAAQGAGSFGGTLTKMGVEIKNADGSIRDTGDIMRDFSDALSAVPDGAQRMSLVTDAFGKGGKAMTDAMSGGSVALNQMIADAVDGGRVLDESVIAKAAALDDRFDKLTGRVKTFFQTIIVDSADAVGALLTVQNQAQATLDAATGGSADQILPPGLADELKKDADAAFDAAGRLELLKANFSYAADQAEALSGQLLEAAASARQMNDSVGAERLQALANVVQQLAADFRSKKISGDEFKTSLDAVAGAATVAVDEISRIDGIDLSNAGTAIDTLRQYLVGLASQAGQTAVAVAAAVLSSAPSPATLQTHGDRADPEYVSKFAPKVSLTPQQRGVDSPALGGGTGSGKGGGGGSSPSHADLDALIKDLESQKAAVDDWYAESAALLAGATETQLAALGGRHAAIEALEVEHRARLRGITDGSNQVDAAAAVDAENTAYEAKLASLQAQTDGELAALGGRHAAIEALEQGHQARLLDIRAANMDMSLGNTASFFGSLATITQAGGAKANKAYQAFAAAEALINAYRAASQALADPKLGFFQKFAAVASVLAAGMSMVSAIKGSGSSSASGSSGGGSGGGGSTPASAPAAPLQVMLTGFGPDDLFTGAMLGSLLDRLNKEAGDRGFTILAPK